MSVVIGLDLATANVRATAVSAGPETRAGTVLATAQRPTPAPERSGDGSSRQDPRYAELSRQVLAEIAGALTGAGPVVAISVTGTSGTVVPCDAAGAPVGPAVLYDDLSAGGDPFPAGGVAARLAMLARDFDRRPARLQFTPDVVLADLAGRPLPTDTSHALKAGIDPVGRSWDPAVLAAVGRVQLPELVHPGQRVGSVCQAAATELGLPVGVLLVSGMTDGCTAQIACGAVEAGDTVGVLGTTLVLKAVAAHRIDSNGVYSHLAPDGLWWAGGAANLGAGALSEFTDLPAMDRAAQAHGPATVRCYPLTGVGERFPVPDPEYRAWWSGTPRDEVDRYRAMLEAIAFAERLGLERLSGLGAPSRRHHAAGGGSRSRVWNQLRADVLGAPLRHPPAAGSGYGAAALAAAGSGIGSLAEVLDDWIGRIEVVQPDPERSAVLDRSYRRWCEELSWEHHPS